MTAPLILGIGGSTRAGSSSEKAVAFALRHAEARGLRTRLIGAELLSQLPMYCAGEVKSAAEVEFLAAVRAADGVILGTPGYHGSLSGLVKNALDLVEETAGDPRPYFSGRPVGCVVTIYGWQAAGATLTALRSIAHALRGWPTPMGAALNIREGGFSAEGEPTLPTAAVQLREVADQVIQLVEAFRTDQRAALAS